MAHSEKSFLTRSFASSFALLSLVGATSFGVAEQSPAIDEIIQKSTQALEPPVKYRVRHNETELTVIQKQLSSGMLGTRTEKAGQSSHVTLSLGQTTYEILPHSRVMIDTTFRMQSAMELSQALRTGMGQQQGIANQELATVTRDGKEYYEIKTRFSEKIPLVAKMLSDRFRESIPESQSLLVDKEHFQPKLLERYAADGSLISKLEYLEIIHDPEITDEAFALPADYELQKPKTTSEYTRLRRELLERTHPIVESSARAAVQIAPLKLPPTPFDPETGFAIPHGMPLDQVKQDVQESLKKRAEEYGLGSNSQPRKSWRLVIVGANLAAILAIALAMLIHSYRKAGV
ncbi:MAG: hypothetical protein U0872_10310 [Planctomycetaceae bacterium]